MTVLILSFIEPFGLGALFYLCFYQNKPHKVIVQAIVILVSGMLTLFFMILLIYAHELLKIVLYTIFFISWAIISYLFGAIFATCLFCREKQLPIDIQVNQENQVLLQ